MTHTYAVVIEPAGLCGRCLHPRRGTGRDPRRDSVSHGGPCQRWAGSSYLQQLGGDGERVRGVGFGLGRLAAQVLAASQAARSAGPWKSSRATPAEAAANASSTRHPEGKGDEVELFIAWGGLEACQAALSVISGTQSFSLLEASRWVVIRLVP